MGQWRERRRDIAQSFACLSDALWSQREALDQLIFKLTSEQLLVTTGHTRWLPRMDTEVRQAAEAFRLGEINRAVAVEELSARHGLPADTTLGHVAAIAPDPWGALLRDHERTLLNLDSRARAIASETSQLLAARSDVAAAAAQDQQDRPARRQTDDIAALVVADAGYSVALTTVKSIVNQLSLFDFLGPRLWPTVAATTGPAGY
jgi:hypothetical protein